MKKINNKMIIPKKILFVQAGLFVVFCQSMQLYEFHTELFEKDKVETEYTVYQLLKKKPLDKNVNYLAVPWAVLINTNQLNKVPSLTLQGGFTVCQHVYYEKIIPILKKIGITTLFTPHVTKTYEDINVVAFPHLAIHGISPQEKNIWYSFVGFNTHWTRRFIFDKLPRQKDVVIKERKTWHFDVNKEKTAALKAQQKQEKVEYQQVLARSRFSLCPRGAGASTLRFWESLQAGAIPVLIADDMQLPKGVDWHRCIVRIPEKEVTLIPNKLATISKEQEQLMRSNCIKTFALFSGENFVSVIRDYYR